MQRFDEGYSKIKSYINIFSSPSSHHQTVSTTDSGNSPNSFDKTKSNRSDMLSAREIERYSLSACNIETNQSTLVKKDESSNQWTEAPTDIDQQDASQQSSSPYTSTPVSKLSEGTTIRISPMEWHCGGWADEHFNEHLKLPLGSNVSKGIVVKLQAKARECVAVALSPTPSFTIGKTYAVHIGAASNLQTVIRRRLPSHTEAVDQIFSTPHICSDQTYRPFWVILQSNGQVSVGVGDVPGVDCIGTLDDSMYHALRSGVDAVRYVGLGNSALGRRARDLKVRNVQVMSIPTCFENQVIPLTLCDPYGSYSGRGGGGDDRASGNDGGNGNGIKDAELWAEYQKECEKAKKRAIKFNIEYKQPAPDAFFKWSEAKRLRANPEQGFITGIDIMSTEEREKAGKRKERFEAEERKNREKGIIGGDNNKIDGGDEQNGDSEMLGDENNVNNNGNEATNKKRDPLPIDQAWDNIDLVENLRVDPPETLFLNSSKSDESEMNGDNDLSEPVRHMEEKIHIFAIDWAAFKQIRTDDILSYFSVYGPSSHVEWLGELSCNVTFGDKYSAARALEGMSRALPLEPPSKKEDQAIEGEDAAVTKSDAVATKSDEVATDDAAEVTNTETSMTTDTNTNTNTAGDDAHMGSATGTDIAKETEPASISNDETPKPLTNLGAMGWRFCNYPIRKRFDDRYGRRGTRSRVLMRMANSLDVLNERPTSWPKPPPEFTTRHVLGPGSNSRKRDRGGYNRSSKRRRRSRGSYEDRYSD